MQRDEIDWGSGVVEYWEMDDIDDSHVFEDQWLELYQDLAQVRFPRNVLLDIGLYPSHQPHGTFAVQIVRNEDWYPPVHREDCRTISELRFMLTRIVRDIENGKYG